MKPTLSDVARIAGVSTTTVNRILNNSGYVSNEKRAIVEQAILQLGYSPRAGSASSSSADMNLIGYVTHKLSSTPLFSYFADALVEEFMKYDYNVIINNSRFNTPSDLVNTIVELQKIGVKGIVFNPIREHPDFSSLQQFFSNIKIPIVMIERTPDLYCINKVLINDRDGMFLIVNHLMKFGHKEMVLFAPVSSEEVEKSRVSGFQAVTAMNNIEGIVHECGDYSAESGYKAIKEYCKSKPLPKAIIAADTIVVGINNYLYENNYRIPEDISIVGINDSLSEFMTPPATSLAFPVDELSKTAVRMILDTDHNSVAQTAMLSPTLIERNSVARPRQKDL